MADSKTISELRAVRVVVLAGFAPSLINFRAPLLAALQARGHEVVACAPADDNTARSLESRGIRYVAIGPARTSLNPFLDIWYCLQLFVFFRRCRPSLVLSYTIKPVIWGSIAARLAGVEQVTAMITGLGSVFTPSRKNRRWVTALVQLLYRAALHGCNAVIFQNPDDEQEFRARGLIRPGGYSFVVNGSGIDLQHFAVAPLPAAPVFLLIARLIADKGIREFVDAARQLKQRYPEAIFRIVGWFDAQPSGIAPAEMQRWCDEGIVEYGGSSNDVRREISLARVFVLPTFYREGVPRTILESMAMGRPIITTDTPGCRETVRHEWNGLLVPPRDVAALRDSMERFILDPSLAESMGVHSREYAAARFECGSVARSVLDGMEALHA